MTLDDESERYAELFFCREPISINSFAHIVRKRRSITEAQVYELHGRCIALAHKRAMAAWPRLTTETMTKEWRR